TRLVRLHANGVLETAFSVTGGAVNSILLQPDDAIVIGGEFRMVAGQARACVARLTAAGALDSAFNSADLFNAGEGTRVYALALRPDGSLLLGGGSFDLNTVYRTGLVAVTGTTSAPAPVIVVQPFSAVATSGGNASFSVSVTAGAPPTYQWRRNGFALPNATN